MIAVIITKIWLSIPLFMAFFLAGLQNMDREQVDAARVDGASNWAILRDLAAAPSSRPHRRGGSGRHRQPAAIRHDLRPDRRRSGP